MTATKIRFDHDIYDGDALVWKSDKGYSILCELNDCYYIQSETKQGYGVHKDEDFEIITEEI